MRKTFLLFLLSLIVAVFYIHGKDDDDSAKERKRKADYIFMEAEGQNQLDKTSDYFRLMELARSYDPDDNFYNKELGYILVLLADRQSDLDSALFNKGMAMMKEGFERDTSDFYNAWRYATICQHFGMTDESLRILRSLSAQNPGKPEVAYSMADLLFQKGDTSDLHKALAIFNSLEKTQGKNLGITSQKVRTYLTLRDTVHALDELSKIRRSFPKSSANQIYSGDVFMVIGKPDSALKYYNRAIELDSTNGLAYHKLAEYYQYMGDSVNYDKEVFNALSQGNLEVGEKVELMRGYVQNLYNDTLQRPRIVKLFDVLTTLHPHDANIRDLYSVYLAVIGDYGQSAEQTRLSLDLNPAEITNWNRLMSLYFTLNEYENAVTTGKEAMHYFPDDSNLKLMTASGFLSLEQPDSAIVLLREAYTATDPSNRETLSDIETSLGDAFYKMHSPDSAFACYEKALELNPRNLLAMNNYSYFLACEGKDLGIAQNLSYMTVKEQPENATYLDTYAWVLFKQKRFEEAKEYIDKTIEYEPEPSAELYDHAGDIYFMNLMPEEAMEYWQKALELDPENSLIQRKVKEKRYIAQ